ncbi:MAG: FecR domain-containing protein [Roseivirga sp.]|uniref:FecR family protein n=1 Tax=Roseivirga sp. TaxID=1964215 RepID=UPI001B1D20AD|nr:FecR domain-containing protein [Roseivirga sp.]MBO6494717.1 FecR domain-containing protein [Roseivirga sp.]
MTGKEHLTDWEQDWLEGKISSQEAKEKAKNDLQFESLDKFVSKAKQLNIPDGISKAEAWSKLESRISKTYSPKVISISRRSWVIGIAASFILAIGAFFILKQNTNQITIETSLAEVRTVELPDGSTVYLNAESSVSFSEKGWATARKVILTGEAFFEVKRGRSFTVETTNGLVQVLGTSFNVRSRANLLQVACKTGKVRVATKDESNEQYLTAGMAVNVENGSISEILEIRVDRIDSWRNGQYDYESIPLEQVLNEVKRLYKVEIEHDFSSSELTSPITTTFSSLKDAAQTIAVQKGRGFEVNEEENTAVFKVK